MTNIFDDALNYAHLIAGSTIIYIENMQRWIGFFVKCIGIQVCGDIFMTSTIFLKRMSALNATKNEVWLE